MYPAYDPQTTSLRSLAAGILVFLVVALPAQDAYLTNAFMPRFVKTATDYTISARVRNYSSTPLFTFRVDWQWNNGAINEGPYQSTTGITGNQYWPYTHPVAFNRPTSEAGVLKVWVVGIGETTPANDTLYFPLRALTAWNEKSMLIEGWTATWCPNCPPANAINNSLDADPRIVVAKHHAADEFSNTSSTEYFNQYNVSFTPAGIIDEGEYGTYPANPGYDQWGMQLEDRKLGVSPVAITMDATVNGWTRELSATVSATFLESVPGDFTINAYVLEDNVAGAQANAPAGYVHLQLVRAVLGGVSGVAGVIPAIPASGTAYDHSWSLTVPSAWDLSNLRLVAYVTDRSGPAQAFTLNVASAPLATVGLNEEAANGIALRLYPDPAHDELWLDAPAMPGKVQVSLLTVDGREVSRSTEVLGGAPVRISGIDRLAPGPYLLRLSAASHTHVVRWVRSAGN